MPALPLLNYTQQKNFDSFPKLDKKQRFRYFAINDAIIKYLDRMHDPINQVDFLVRLAYFRASGKFFTSESFKKVDLKYACELLELKNINIDNIAANYNAKRKSIHKAYILELCGWHKFTEQCVEKLHTELLSHAKQQMHPKSLLSIAAGYLITYKIELPPYYVFANIISNV